MLRAHLKHILHLFIQCFHSFAWLISKYLCRIWRILCSNWFSPQKLCYSCSHLCIINRKINLWTLKYHFFLLVFNVRYIWPSMFLRQSNCCLWKHSKCFAKLNHKSVNKFWILFILIVYFIDINWRRLIGVETNKMGNFRHVFIGIFTI